MTPDMPLRTSASHPITLSSILAWQGGSLGLCFCPGKCVNRDGARHKRSLQQDLKHLQERYGITGLVCLLNTAELRVMLALPQFKYIWTLHKTFWAFQVLMDIAQDLSGQIPLDRTSCTQLGSTCRHELFSITATASCSGLSGAVLATRAQVCELACRGGVGRAGLIAACLLLYTQQAATGQEAITMVRRRRCKSAIETTRQEEFVCKYAKLCQHEQASNSSASSDCTAVMHADITTLQCEPKLASMEIYPEPQPATPAMS